MTDSDIVTVGDRLRLNVSMIEKTNRKLGGQTLVVEVKDIKTVDGVKVLTVVTPQA